MSFLSDTLGAKIKGAVELSKTFSNLEHSGTKGRLRELVVTELINPLLPNGVSATTGLLIDSKGNQSNQLDIIIYTSDILPPLFQSTEQSVIPVDAAIQVIEIKSQLNATEMKISIENAKSVKSLIPLDPGQPYPSPFNKLNKNNIKNSMRVSPICSLFAFGSDLKRKTEWERYLEIKNDLKDKHNHVILHDICVVGSGYWNEVSEEYVKTTDNYHEVMVMLTILVNSIPLWKKMRGTPQFGRYLIG